MGWGRTCLAEVVAVVAQQVVRVHGEARRDLKHEVLEHLLWDVSHAKLDHVQWLPEVRASWDPTLDPPLE